MDVYLVSRVMVFSLLQLLSSDVLSEKSIGMPNSNIQRLRNLVCTLKKNGSYCLKSRDLDFKMSFKESESESSMLLREPRVLSQ